MIELIQTTGVLSVYGNNYIDPLINVYYVSYNSNIHIFAFPQLVDVDLAPYEQLFMAIVDNGATINRTDITNSMIMLLENTYPNCTFTKILI